jgi:hypothetical protein
MAVVISGVAPSEVIKAYLTRRDPMGCKPKFMRGGSHCPAAFAAMVVPCSSTVTLPCAVLVPNSSQAVFSPALAV